MANIDIRVANKNFSRLIKRAEGGETILVTRAGKPVVKLVRLEPETTDRFTVAARRLGFMKGEFSIPDDFNEMYRDEIEAMFNGPEDEEPA